MPHKYAKPKLRATTLGNASTTRRMVKMDQQQKEKMTKILIELRTAEQHTINALNHIRDLGQMIEGKQKASE